MLAVSFSYRHKAVKWDYVTKFALQYSTSDCKNTFNLLHDAACTCEYQTVLIGKTYPGLDYSAKLIEITCDVLQ